MSLALIDHKSALQLVEALFTTTASTTVIFPGEQEPDDVARMARLIAVDIRHERRVSSAGQGDFANVVVSIVCACSEAEIRNDNAALEVTVGRVLLKMAQKSSTDANRHVLHLGEAVVTYDKDPDPITRRRTAGITIRGVIERRAFTGGMSEEDLQDVTVIP